MLYSDKWIRLGYIKGKRVKINNGEPVDYCYWYDEEKIVGACINLEYAEDAHYEFEFAEFKKLHSLWGRTEKEFTRSMELFFDAPKPYFMFSDFLDENDIEYKRVVYADW